jgi:hypothetical protein
MEISRSRRKETMQITTKLSEDKEVKKLLSAEDFTPIEVYNFVYFLCRTDNIDKATINEKIIQKILHERFMQDSMQKVSSLLETTLSRYNQFKYFSPPFRFDERYNHFQAEKAKTLLSVIKDCCNYCYIENFRKFYSDYDTCNQLFLEVYNKILIDYFGCEFADIFDYLKVDVYSDLKFCIAID